MTVTPMRSALILLLALSSSAPDQESQCPTLTRAENDVEGLSSCRCGKELRNVTVTPPKGLELRAACSLWRWETDGSSEIPKSRPVNLDSYDSVGNSLNGRYYFGGHLRLKGLLRFEPSDGGELFFYPTAPVTMPKSALEPSFRSFTLIPNGRYTTYSIDQRIRGIGISIGAGRLSVEYPTRSPPARAPSDGHWRARGLVRAPRGPWERRAPRGERCRRGPIRRAGGTAAHAEGPRVAAGRRGRAQGTVGASADGRGARDAPRLAGARVDGGLLAPAWVACAAREARVRRCARIWSITDAWVMNATMRMAPWQVGHASESTSNICCSRVAHRRLASVGARRGAATMAGGAQGAGSACRRMPRGRLAYQP